MSIDKKIEQRKSGQIIYKQCIKSITYEHWTQHIAGQTRQAHQRINTKITMNGNVWHGLVRYLQTFWCDARCERHLFQYVHSIATMHNICHKMKWVCMKCSHVNEIILAYVKGVFCNSVVDVKRWMWNDDIQCVAVRTTKHMAFTSYSRKSPYFKPESAATQSTSQQEEKKYSNVFRPRQRRKIIQNYWPTIEKKVAHRQKHSLSHKLWQQTKRTLRFHGNRRCGELLRCTSRRS